jgi:hypothetical protein
MHMDDHIEKVRLATAERRKCFIVKLKVKSRK